jgi:hypothetical protein
MGIPSGNAQGEFFLCRKLPKLRDDRGPCVKLDEEAALERLPAKGAMA